MRTRSNVLPALAAAILAATVPALAQIPAAGSNVYTLDEVIVTAERVRHPVRDVAASVSVLAGEEIRRSSARTATDALAGLPGVFLQRTGQFGRTDIDVRGVGDRGCRIAVLVDGRPEKMSLFGCTVTHTLPLNNVERIELVRGPLSVLYGSDAMAGVLNIVTRRATRPVDVSGRVEYGSFNTIHSRVAAGTSQGSFDVLASADKAVSDGHLDNSRYNGNDLSLRAGFDPSPAVGFDFTGKYFTGVKHEPKRATDPETLVATGWNQYDRGGVDLTANLATALVNGFLKLYRTFGEHQFDPTDGWHSTDNTDGALLHLHRRFAFDNLVQLGVDLKNHAGRWQAKLPPPLDTGSAERTEAAVFLQSEQAAGPARLNAGIRLSHDAVSGSVLCPKAGIVFHATPRAALRASINKGFRSPPFNYTHIFPPRNESLAPEITWNYETGLNWEPVSGVGIDIAGFILDGTNLIELGPGMPKRYQNLGSFRFKGIEFGLTGRMKALRGRLAGTLIDHGVHTRARPGAKLDASVGLDAGRFTADIAAHAVGRYYAADSAQSPIPSYTTLDCRAGFRLRPGLDVFAGLENALDARYNAFADLPGTAAGLFEQPGRSFTVGLDFNR